MDTKQHESSAELSASGNAHGLDEPSDRPRISYYGPHRNRPRAKTLVIVLICIYSALSALQLLLIIHEAMYGDPPNNLKEFQFYHYATAAISLLGIAGIVIAVVALRGKERVAIVALGIVSCALTNCLAAKLLDVLHTHPAGMFYMTQWLG